MKIARENGQHLVISFWKKHPQRKHSKNVVSVIWIIENSNVCACIARLPKNAHTFITFSLTQKSGRLCSLKVAGTFPYDATDKRVTTIKINSSNMTCSNKVAQWPLPIRCTHTHFSGICVDRQKKIAQISFSDGLQFLARNQCQLQ